MRHPARLLSLVQTLLLGVGLGVTPTRAAAEATPAVDLQPRWVEGRVTRYAFETQRLTDLVFEAAGQTREARNRFTSEGEVTWRVRDVNRDGSAEAEFVYDWLRLTFENPQGDTEVADSRRGSGDDPRLQALVEAVAGTPLTVDMAADGSVIEIAGMDAIRRKTDFPETVPEDRDFLEAVTDQISLPAAPADAEPGDQWQQSFTWGHQAGDLQYDTTYTLVEVAPMAGVPVALLRSESELDLDPTEPDVPPDGPDIETRLESGAASAQIMFDLSRNQAVGRHESEQTVVLTSVRTPQGPLTQTTTIRVSRQLLRIAEQ